MRLTEFAIVLRDEGVIVQADKLHSTQSARIHVHKIRTRIAGLRDTFGRRPLLEHLIIRDCNRQTRR